MSFIHRKAGKEAAQELDLWLPVLRKSQRLNYWALDLAFSGRLALSCLPTALFQSCLSSLQGGPEGVGQLVLLTLGEVAWALVHQDWFLHICKVPYSSQTPPPMVKPQVLAVDHEGNYSLPPARPDSSVRQLKLMPGEQESSERGAQLSSPAHSMHV